MHMHVTHQLSVCQTLDLELLEGDDHARVDHYCFVDLAAANAERTRKADTPETRHAGTWEGKGRKGTHIPHMSILTRAP